MQLQKSYFSVNPHQKCPEINKKIAIWWRPYIRDRSSFELHFSHTFQHCVLSGSPACPKASTVILVLWCGDDSNAVICLAGRLNWWWWRTRLFGSRRTSAPFSNIGTPPFSLAFCLFQSISGVDWRRNIIFSSEVISSSFSILVYHISVIFIFRKTGVINFTFSYIYI